MTNKYEFLAFVQPRGDGTYDFWAPMRTESYAENCAIGRLLAQDLLTFMTENGRSDLLGAVVKSVAESGRFDGIEAGFFQELGERLSA